MVGPMTGLRGKLMGKIVLSLAALCCLLSSAAVAAQNSKTFETIPVDQIHAGMRGLAYTVFQGVKPEPMEVEVLGVMKNVNGPKGDVILVRLHGTKVEYTGVVAGMSGSPVYFDGKLAGALAFRIGEFSKEPIAGVTPISEMLEINAMDRTPAGDSAPVQAKARNAATKTVGPGENSSSFPQDFSNYLKPIETPLVFNGFSEETVRRFAPQFASAGIVAVMGIGSHSDVRQPESLEPGSTVSAILVRGDMEIAATCTVTYVDPQRLLACGHPLLQFGMVDIPMTKAQVLATLPSPLNAFKIVNTTEPVGAFVQDRHTGILGRFDRQPQMIPVKLTIHGASGPREFHYEVLNNAKMTPLMMMATVFNALQGMNQYGEETTYHMNGHIQVDGYPAVRVTNMFSPVDTMPTAFAVAVALGDHFNRIFGNPFEIPNISGVSLEFNLEKDRRSAALESART